MEATDKAASTAFEDRSIVLPCCGVNDRLETLRYEWPMGFARFVVEVRNANMGEPTTEDDAQVAELLQVPVRRTMAHY